MKIRRTNSCALIEHLNAQCFPAAGDAYRPEETDLMWLATAAGGQHAGFAVLTRDGFLARAGVLPDYRGFGLHKKLIRVRVRAARRLVLDRVWTYTTAWNSASANNLIDCGFRVYAPHRLGWYSDETCVYWRKVL